MTRWEKIWLNTMWLQMALVLVGQVSFSVSGVIAGNGFFLAANCVLIIRNFVLKRPMVDHAQTWLFTVISITMIALALR